MLRLPAPLCYDFVVGHPVVFFSGVPHPHLLGVRVPDPFLNKAELFDRSDGFFRRFLEDDLPAAFCAGFDVLRAIVQI